MVKNIIAGLFIITTVSLIGCNYSNINEKQEEQGIESSEEGIDKPLNSAVSEVLLDNEIVKIMGYRSIDLSKIKDKEEKAYYRKMKELHKIPVSQSEKEKLNEIEKTLLNGGDISKLL